ncbi:DUF4604 domain-containing protein [Aspergillus fischeri NRRL 181]|uniref:DUF4604 domain-containing protein n=1 Tax=Neosartorya fischeri (strain ATCC 1020 / DSM 3700 / CBS 544.65 / FGSC A1164 / JCM 1740 / NRRL 181 / WB 181) TaxID=331117 RepID=A1DDI1_NEOFI|nr:uncharacterized protein NFIA_073540 [Aspergillus fischeri NRRL 181]EAW17438.1 hypothetical protein NFIA_073540 [Aspergillus fischeri NRRL 181]KAG2025393.1 hypothetical protein GB937_002643 [Aspergillus fischeri]
MSFNAKNLAYENKQPAFLQKLRNQYGDTSGRLERPVARPRLAKKDDEDDDEPTYVDEQSNEVISKEEYEALLRGDEKQQESFEKQSGHESKQDTERPDAEVASSKQNLAGIGGPKKRKQAKVIADDSVEAENNTQQASTGPQKAKQKQKKKKIKLSFDE